MSAQSSIEWTDATWNPVTGCTEVSRGCEHCYAKTFAERWRGVPGHHFERGFDVVLRPERLKEPYRWRKPRRVFVNSMSDLFHRDVPDVFIRDVFQVMAETVFCPYGHTYQVLTKRPHRMKLIMPTIWRSLGLNEAQVEEAQKHIWLGVSIEDSDNVWRADMLRDTPARMRFLSVEPMLGPLDVLNLSNIDWVIVGGESGHGARPMELAWARDLRNRCHAARIPFFFKQVGKVRAGHGKGGDAASIPADLNIREFPV